MKQKILRIAWWNQNKKQAVTTEFEINTEEDWKKVKDIILKNNQLIIRIIEKEKAI